jgi:hypothetical protein
MRINRTIVAELERVAAHLDALCDVKDDSRCSVDPAHKEAVRLYLQSWVTPVLASALSRIRGEKDSRIEGRQARRSRIARSRK